MAEVEIRAVSKAFKKAQAVSDLSLTVGDGEFVALLGPTGRSVGDRVRELRQARRHEPDEIGFDLEVNIVRVRVIGRRPGKSSWHSPLQSSTCGEIRMPECIFGLLKLGPEIFGCGVQTLLVDHLRERHIDIQIVLLERVQDAFRCPDRQFLLWNDLGTIPEFSRSPVAHPDHLASPTALDFVTQHVERNHASL